MAPRKPKEQPTHQHLITTPLRDGRCGTCKAIVWRGYVGGVYTELDPVRINQQAEIGATLAGVATYHVPAIGTRRPGRRTRWNFARWPERGFVHAAHQCGRTWPDSCRDTRSDMPWIDPDTYARITAEECPF
ncbi:hypothetical protein H7J71_25120 [Mycolicibacterium peregrinum]|uniref:hypothetical protein n=1 Tax=Mycolicibacterium peregrinum TaxID=43304 RepID=UPI0006D8118B|nr:hypothetical protein [Mycolicibacterium peregrinum]MCV7205290.1 hypothetical protein [Mycolicibacterium peregrinum]ORW54810.1 hypothetical protein AWC21_24015 [Mycolicibacterium peregrinum]